MDFDVFPSSCSSIGVDAEGANDLLCFEQHLNRFFLGVLAYKTKRLERLGSVDELAHMKHYFLCEFVQHVG